MKALRISDYGAALKLEEDVPMPTAGPGQVVVRNLATSFNPIDVKRASGMLKAFFPLSFPWTPGGDVSGIVDSVGEGVTGFAVGDSVFGYRPDGGAYAEFVSVDSGALAVRPLALTAIEAAAVGVVGQTAIQVLQLARVSAGTTVLIQGGSGGVGTLAIQIAHQAGAHVITTAHAEHTEELLHLGAERVAGPGDVVEPVDALVDLIGGETLARSYALVKRGGVLVTATQPPDPADCEKHGIQGVFVQTSVTTEGLNDFAKRVTAGNVTPVVGLVETLWSPEKIWEKRTRATVGKIVFTIGEGV